MTIPNLTGDAPGSAMFPEYSTLYDLIASEVEGLSDSQLDFTSDRWEWSEWSIRTQLSHMASLLYRWMLLRWGETLFPDGDHGVEDVKGLADSASDRRLDDEVYRDIPVILEKLGEGIDLVQRVLADHSVNFLKGHTIPHQRSVQWTLMFKAHPSGITPAVESGEGRMALEATMRHMYFEEITHLYNIQRLKRAQGLRAIVDLPRVGYWTLDGWDRSEP